MAKKLKNVETVVESVSNASELETLTAKIQKDGYRPTQEEGTSYVVALFASLVSVAGWRTLVVDLLADKAILPRCILAACGWIGDDGKLLAHDDDRWTKEVGEGQRRLVPKNVTAVVDRILSMSLKIAPGLGIDLVETLGSIQSANGMHRLYGSYVASERADVASSTMYTYPIFLNLRTETPDGSEHENVFSAYDNGGKLRDGVDMVTIVSGTLDGASIKAQSAMILHSRLEGNGGTYSPTCTPNVVASYVETYPSIGYAADFIRDIDERQVARNKENGNQPKKLASIVPPAYVGGLDSLCQMIDARLVDSSAYDFLTFKGPTTLPNGWTNRPRVNSGEGAIVGPPLSDDIWQSVEFSDESTPSKSEAGFLSPTDWGPLTVRFRTFVLRLIEAFADRENSDHSPILRDLAKRLSKGGGGYVTGRDGMLADVTQSFLAWSGLWALPENSTLPDLSSGDYRTHLGKVDSKLRDKARENASKRAKTGSMPRLGGFDLRPCDR